MSKNSLLQNLCREYLDKLRPFAEPVGLGGFIDTTIQQNEEGTCIATKDQVDLLAKMCDDDRIRRDEVPQYAGISYRSCILINLFDKIRKFANKGAYSKIDAMLFKSEAEEQEKEREGQDE